MVERLDQKDRIGAAAAALVADGQTIMLDIGTTTLQLARHLRGRKVTVITTNLAAYEELLPETPSSSCCSAASCGATTARSSACSPRTRCASCAPTSRSSARPASARISSVVDTTMVEVPIKRAMLAAGEATVLLADSAKFGDARRPCASAAPAELDAVVTDDEAPRAAAGALAPRGWR